MNKGIVWVVVCLMAIFGMVACGGGGGGTGGSGYAIYGTAAAGAPIAGIVNVKGANGAVAQTTISSDGTYGFTATQLAALTKPYMLYAQGTVNGKSASLYSACVADGRINITPITDFIVRNALSMAAETAYQNWNTTAGSLTSDALATAESKAQTQLQPLLDAVGVDSIVDLMSGQFSANHTGLDKVLDIVSVTYDSAGTTATITNTVTNNSFTDNVTTTNDDANALPAGDTTATQAALTDEAAINNVFSSLCSLYSTTMPSASALTNWWSANVATDFLDKGEDGTQMLSDYINNNDGPGVGCTITTTISAPLTGLPQTYSKGYLVTATYRDPRFTGSDIFTTKFVFNGTKWIWYGDQQWLEIDFYSEAHRQTSSSGSTFYSGIQMWIKDQYSYAYNNGVRSAVVSATVGTTTAYVVLANQYPQTWYNIVSGCSNNHWSSHCWLDDSIISQLADNMPYTVKLCSEDATALVNNPTACTALQTYTGSIGKKPLLNSQLSDALFPTLTTPSSFSLSGMGWDDGFVQVNWTNATQGPPVYFVQLGWWDGMNENRSEQDVTSTTTSVNIDTLGTTTPPQSAWIWMSSRGIAGDVEYSASWNFYQQ